MPESAPVLPLLGVRRNHVVPQTMGVIVRPQARVDDVNMLVLAQLLFNLGPFKKHVLLLATPLFVLCETNAVHHQSTMNFLDRSFRHEFLLQDILFSRLSRGSIDDRTDCITGTKRFQESSEPERRLMAAILEDAV